MHAILLITLTLTANVVTSQEADPRLEEEMKCLKDNPEDQCDLAVTYPKPLTTLSCNYLVGEGDGAVLSQPPTMNMRGLTGPLSKGVVVMFDPDAPVAKELNYGFVHWIAMVSVDEEGNIKIGETITDYYPPKPPRGAGQHRYQLFLFDYGSGNKIPAYKRRKFDLCSFIQSNSLGQPLASFQFRFERT